MRLRKAHLQKRVQSAKLFRGRRQGRRERNGPDRDGLTEPARRRVLIERERRYRGRGDLARWLAPRVQGDCRNDQQQPEYQADRKPSGQTHDEAPVRAYRELRPKRNRNEKPTESVQRRAKLRRS
jgi:hypothetical protein